MRRCMPLAATVLLLMPATMSAQENGPDLPSGFDEPMPLHHDGKGLGPFSREITTSSHEAQLYFDQGVQLSRPVAPAKDLLQHTVSGVMRFDRRARLPLLAEDSDREGCQLGEYIAHPRLPPLLPPCISINSP